MSSNIKSVAVLRAEGKSHRTKAELALRERSEEAMLTGIAIVETEEVKANPVAHAQFERLTFILSRIGKNDELFGAGCRRYCLTTAKLYEHEEGIKRLQAMCDDATPAMRARIENLITRNEKLSLAMHRELTDFERSCGMTVASALRLIPKRVEEKPDPILEILNGYQNS